MSTDMTLLDIMKSAVVIPVIAIDDPDHAVPLAKALVAGGIRVLEVTLRTKHGLDAIRAMSEVEGAIVGVGTLTQPEEFAASRDAGAVFGVSPGLTPALIEAAKKIAAEENVAYPVAMTRVKAKHPELYAAYARARG